MIHTIRSFWRRIGGVPILAILACGIPSGSRAQQGTPPQGSVFAKSNLVAWCIVPFDSKNRGPEERAVMLNRLGIRALAYDWREKHVPGFDQELEALRNHHIRLQCFWFYSGYHPETDKNLAIILDLFRRHGVKTQLWCMFVPDKSMGFDSLSQAEKLRLTAIPVAYVAGELARIGCSLGLYNHGGWFGEPENQLALIDLLKRPNIGMVYNFSHAETQIQRFPEFFPRILPHLYCLNITGMKGLNPSEVVPVGQGDVEERMISLVRKSAYKGPIGIINENFAPDAEAGLRMNMEGLQKILARLGDRTALKTYR